MLPDLLLLLADNLKSKMHNKYAILYSHDKSHFMLDDNNMPILIVYTKNNELCAYKYSTGGSVTFDFECFELDTAIEAILSL